MLHFEALSFDLNSMSITKAKFQHQNWIVACHSCHIEYWVEYKFMLHSERYKSSQSISSLLFAMPCTKPNPRKF